MVGLINLGKNETKEWICTQFPEIHSVQRFNILTFFCSLFATSFWHYLAILEKNIADWYIVLSYSIWTQDKELEIQARQIVEMISRYILHNFSGDIGDICSHSLLVSLSFHSLKLYISHWEIPPKVLHFAAFRKRWISWWHKIWDIISDFRHLISINARLIDGWVTWKKLLNKFCMQTIWSWH